MRVLSLRAGLLGVVFITPTFASPCTTQSLAAYVSLGSGGCTINGEIVDSFNFNVISTSLGSPLTAGAITVTPSFTASTFELTFSATGNTPSTGFTVSGPDFAMYGINFNWDPLVGGAGDDMIANTPVPPGTATVSTNECAGAFFSGTSCPATEYNLTVFNNGIPLDDINSAMKLFASQVLQVGTQSTIDLESNTSGSSTITGFDTYVFITPEPGSALAMMAGLAALAARRLRQR
jgi:hypothetical protein